MYVKFEGFVVDMMIYDDNNNSGRPRNSVATVQTGYTDRAAAAGRQVSTDVSRIEGCHGVSVTNPPRPLISVSRPGAATYFIQVAPQLTPRGSRGWVDPVQTHYQSENLAAPRIEPGTSVSVARNSDH
jgi:hypothetical protein